MSLRPFALTMLAVTSLLLPLAGCVQDKGTNPIPAEEPASPGLLGAATGSRNYVHVFTTPGPYPYHCASRSDSRPRRWGEVRARQVAHGEEGAADVPAARATT